MMLQVPKLLLRNISPTGLQTPRYAFYSGESVSRRGIAVIKFKIITVALEGKVLYGRRSRRDSDYNPNIIV